MIDDALKLILGPQHWMPYPTWEDKMGELLVLRERFAVTLTFGLLGLAEGMQMIPDGGRLPKSTIPDHLEVVVRRVGDCVEVITRPQSVILRTDARLHAAAPDLLAALQEVLAAPVSGDHQHIAKREAAFVAARAAIAKAIGDA